MRHLIAIAEDEPDLREAVEEYLARAGFDVIGAGSAAEFRQLAEGRRIHVAILDIMMPGEDGLSLARWLKGQGPVGLILATALGRPIDRVVGLDIGADDYVVKPYDLRELLARVRSIIRRLADSLAEVPVPVSPAARPAMQVLLGSLTLDPERRDLVGADGVMAGLSAAEYDALSVLAHRAGQIVTRAALAEGGGGDTGDTAARAIDVRIARLRKKMMALDPTAGALLRTVRGEGYLLDASGTR